MPGIANDGSEDHPNVHSNRTEPAGNVRVSSSPNGLKLTASVRVTLQVEVTVGTYGGGSSFNDVHQNSIKEAKRHLASLLGQGVRIVGEPVATHVIMKGE